MSLRVAAFTLALAVAAPALAQAPMANVADVGGAPGGGRAGAMKACRADHEKYCADVEKGGGRVMKCMKEHASELSSGCKSALQSMRAARQAGR
jgi:hypothetical protein